MCGTGKVSEEIAEDSGATGVPCSLPSGIIQAGQQGMCLALMPAGRIVDQEPMQRSGIGSGADIAPRDILRRGLQSHQGRRWDYRIVQVGKARFDRRAMTAGRERLNVLLQRRSIARRLDGLPHRVFGRRRHVRFEGRLGFSKIECPTAQQLIIHGGNLVMTDRLRELCNPFTNILAQVQKVFPRFLQLREKDAGENGIGIWIVPV